MPRRRKPLVELDYLEVRHLGHQVQLEVHTLDGRVVRREVFSGDTLRVRFAGPDGKAIDELAASNPPKLWVHEPPPPPPPGQRPTSWTP